VDLIKVLSTGAVLTHNSNPRSDEFTPEELQAAVDEASHFGLRVAAHAPLADRNQERDSSRRGVYRARYAVDDEGIALAKQRGTYLDMDIYDEECIQAKGLQNAIPKDFLEHDANWARSSGEFSQSSACGVKWLSEPIWSLLHHGACECLRYAL